MFRITPNTIKELTEEIVNLIDADFKKSGDEYRLNCPSCGDTQKKLYISFSEDGGGKVLLHCKHECSSRDILKTCGLEMRDLFLKNYNKKPDSVRREIARRSHIYTDEQGKQLFKKDIVKYNDGGKICYWSRRGEHGEWITGIGGNAVPLYHLPNILDASTIFITEGEKDTETLEKLGFTSTCYGNKWEESHKQYFCGKDVIILSDNDATGEEKGRKAVDFMFSAGASSVKLIPTTAIYPNALEKWDVTDVFEAVGGDVDKTTDFLHKAIENAEIICTSTPEEVIEINADGTGRLTIFNLEKALKFYRVTIRYNCITHKPEYSGGILSNMDPGERVEILPTLLFDNLQHHNLKGCNMEKISSFLNVILSKAENRYNPALQKINAAVWDGKSRFSELCELLSISENDSLSRTLLLHWAMECYCGLFSTLENPIAHENILVLVGPQGFGKTRLFQKLALGMFGEGKSIDPSNKDDVIEATQYWITELGEIGSTLKRDKDALKAFFSRQYDEYRRPYGRSTVSIPRLTTFCGSCNETNFLIDDTGNRRYWVIPLTKDKSKRIKISGDAFKNFDSLQFWAEIKDIVERKIEEDGESYASVFRLPYEIEELSELRNNSFMKQLPGEEEVIDVLTNAQTPEPDYELYSEWLTVTEFKEMHKSELSRYTVNQISKVLKKFGYQIPDTSIRRDGKHGKLIQLPCKKWIGISRVV